VRIFVLSILTGSFLVSPAFAWHDTGHRTIASIAFDAIKPDRREKVIAILRTHPRFRQDFVAHMPDTLAAQSDAGKARWLLEQAAIWPDLIKEMNEDIQTEFNRSRWHYINLPVYLSESDETALDSSLSHNMATRFEPPLRQNLNIVQALRGNLQVWHSASTSDADKAIALCWILHLTGDLHQPLHNVALFSRPYFSKGDRGGNDIEVLSGDATRNLHAVWDGLPTTMENLEPSVKTLAALESDTVDNEVIDVWLVHHARLAEMFVYTDDVKKQLLQKLTNDQPPTITLSHEYLVRARSISRRQVNLAGHRIAKLLN